MRRHVGWLVAAALMALGGSARADTQDLRLYKLGSPRRFLGDARTSTLYSAGAQSRFNALCTEFGLALAAPALLPARTVGPGGFEFGFGWTSAEVNADARVDGQRYWVTEDDRPDPWLQMPTVVVRKGLPFGFEVGARVQYLMRSEIVAAGLDLKLAFVEGYRDLPDIAITLHGTRLVGSRELDLLTAGGDLGLSKRFAIAGMFTLMPYAGWDVVAIMGNSNVVDFDPYFEDPANPSLDDGVFEQFVTAQNRVYLGARFGVGDALVGLEYGRALAGSRSVSSLTVSTGLAF
jgi:hypothetical protein